MLKDSEWNSGTVMSGNHLGGADLEHADLERPVGQMCEIGKDNKIGMDIRGKTAYRLYSEQLSEAEIRRYNRQIILPEVGSDGQKKLKNAKVLIVGAGGLGSPAALYLAGAGIGTLGIIDADTVSISNLQRQIVHNTEREQMNKAESAKLSLQKLNSHIEVKTYPYALTPDNAEDMISGYDFIIDAVDNFETKFLINDVCVLLEKPFCHAGILRFEGQAMTYVPGDYPCYRCVFEGIPQGDSAPNCSGAGIIGAVAGIIGSIQALEAIKYLLGAGELLTGKLFVFDGLSMTTRIVRFHHKNRNCTVCGSHGRDVKYLDSQICLEATEIERP